MTAQSRSAPNTARLALGSARPAARDKRDPIRHASSIDHGARRPHAPGCLQRAPGGEAGGGEELGQMISARTDRRHAPTGAVSAIGGEHARELNDRGQSIRNDYGTCSSGHPP